MTEVNAVLLGILPGAVGGFCNVLTGHPLDVIKVRQQILGGRVSNMVQSIVMTEGWMGLYAGLSAPMLAVVPSFAMVFWSYEMTSRYLTSNSNGSQKQLTLAQTCIAGAVSGVPLALVLGPLEKCKCELQIGRYSTLWESFQATFRNGTLFRGTGLTLLRDVPGNAAYFGAYEFFRRNLASEMEQSSKPSIGVTLLAGGMAGVCNWTVAIPMDVLKSRFQVDNYANYRHVWVHLMQSEGPAALFRGLGAALLRAFPANAACLLGVETARGFLHRDL